MNHNFFPSATDLETSNLRLRGGKRIIQIDQRLSHWWETSQWPKFIVATVFAALIYILPSMPRIEKFDPVLVIECKIGVSLVVVGGAFLLAGPIIQDALGWWTLGFAPISETIFLMGVILIAHSVGETIADARDKALQKDTANPYSPSFESNYRIKG